MLPSSGSAQYYVEDMLGSSRVVTDPGGTILDDSDFYPFGGERAVVSSSGNNYKFTGKERDSESGLDNFGARYDSSSLGRFMTPDWSAMPTTVPYAVFGDPQSLNLYAYVENAPLNRADADGHDFRDWLKNLGCIFGKSNLCPPVPPPPPPPAPPGPPKMKGVNPVTGQTFMARRPKGQPGNERPGVGGAGNFGAPRPANPSGRHAGEDIYGTEGTGVHAATAGTVTESDVNGTLTSGYGNTVKVQNGHTVTVYTHLSDRSVARGDVVEQGEVVGSVGQTGNAHDLPASEMHLHFEVRVNGQLVDPYTWLNTPED
jgi:RHS repeat-associated protein